MHDTLHPVPAQRTPVIASINGRVAALRCIPVMTMGIVSRIESFPLQTGHFSGDP